VSLELRNVERDGEAIEVTAEVGGDGFNAERLHVLLEATASRG
jgi:hypothetical protein